MADIVLIQPPVRDFYLTTKRTIPYGLACMATALSRAGFSVVLLDALATSKARVVEWPSEMDYLRPFYGQEDRSPFALFHGYKQFGYSLEHIGAQVRRLRPFLVGISSLFTAYSAEALETAATVKRWAPECRVVMGGYHPTALPEAVMGSPDVDFVVRGEGEAALPALSEALRAGRSVASVPGLVWRRPDGRLQLNPPAVMENLEDCPPPACHLLRHDFYRRGSRPCAVVVASRGCPLHCSYCSVGSAAQLPYRRRSVAAVLGELETAVLQDGVRFIDFEDENLSLARGWFLDLLHAIAVRYAPYSLELRAMNGLLPTTLDDEVVCAMRNAGFKTLNLSLGSSNRAQLQRFQRPDVLCAFDEALGYAEKYGLQAVAYIIVGAPGQSPLQSVEDLLFLASRRVLAGVSVYYPAPGSVDYQRCADADLLPESYSLMRSSAFPISDTTSRLEAVTLVRLGRIINFCKALLDQGSTLPAPVPCRSEQLEAMADRSTIGRTLLQWFLHDGLIRGITPEGRVFVHRTDPDLTARFLAGLSAINLRGTI
jgi:anaerobic magnesium-protoporphyrin IX monomethyl ester cyclase